MSRFTRRSALTICALLLAVPAFAHEIVAGSLVIHHPWSRATPTGAKTAAVYMMLHNKGDKPDRLIGAETGIAESAEFHETIMNNDVMSMKPVDGIDIPAGGAADLAPHGLHIMLFGVKQSLSEYDTFNMTLIFEHAGRVKIEVEVEGLGASEPLH
jgi:copper(I)-binding protein